MATWPAGLPQFVVVDGYASSVDELARAVTKIDAPYPRMRRRTDNAPLTHTMLLPPMTFDQVETLDVFFLANTALAWDWVNPVSQVSTTMRFVGAPSYAAAAGGLFNVTMTVEVI